MPKSKSWVYNGKRLRIIDTKLLARDCEEMSELFQDSDFNLAIWDKSLGLHIGSAKQNIDGSYSGFTTYGMHELDIEGATLRELARDAYINHLWSLNN